MCDKLCDEFETLDPQIEFQKYLKRKPMIDAQRVYEGVIVKEKVLCPYKFKSYGIEKETNNMYRTYNSEYGYYSPNAYTIPSRYFPKSQKVSNELFRCGMYRNFSLNMQMDRSFY